MKKIFTISYILLLSFKIFSQDTIVNWLSFEETLTKFTEFQKPVLVYLYAKDDNKSKKLIETTFKNSEVSNYINILFYPIKFDVTTTDSIKFFDGQVYRKQKESKYHSLAKFLTGDSVLFPTIIMFNKKGEGAIFSEKFSRDSIFPLLIYYSEEIFKSTLYDEWEKNYFLAYPPGQSQIITRMKIKWLTIEEAKELHKNTPKKFLIEIYDNYNNASTVMRLQTYNNQIIASYLNSTYYRVSINLRSQEEFEFKGYIYKNLGVQYKNYHEFAVATLEGKMVFPAFLILDEELNLLDRVQVFLTPQTMEPIIKYYGDNHYKTIDYNAFIKDFKPTDFGENK